MSETQEGQVPGLGEQIDFVVSVYKGCVLPEDYKPTRVTSWSKFQAEDPELFTTEQWVQIGLRLMNGRSWVLFDKKLETLAAAEYYQPLNKRGQSQ